MSEKLFVYGTLRDPEVQKKVIRRVVSGKTDVLEGFTKGSVLIHEKMYPQIFPQQNSSVEGFVLDITFDDLKPLDEYETDTYARKKVFLRSSIEAWAYQKP